MLQNQFYSMEQQQNKLKKGLNQCSGCAALNYNWKIENANNWVEAFIAFFVFMFFIVAFKRFKWDGIISVVKFNWIIKKKVHSIFKLTLSILLTNFL